MGDWRRSTRECPSEELTPAFRDAVEAHIAYYNLGDILSDRLMCVETISEKTKKGLLGGRGELIRVGAIITPRWLIWAIYGAQAEATAMSARLADVVIQDYATTKSAKLVPDTGLEVSGSFTDVPDRGSAFIGLGPEAASESFRETVIQAAQAAKRR